MPSLLIRQNKIAPITLENAILPDDFNFKF